MNKPWKSLIILIISCSAFLFLGAWASYPQHMDGYPYCYNLNGYTNCTDGWSDSYIQSVSIYCWNNQTYKWLEYCYYNCPSVVYPHQACNRSQEMLMWYTMVDDGTYNTVYHYWCTDSNSNIYNCGYGGCDCPGYCGNSTCESGESCAADCSYEMYCDDYSDNDEDGYTDSADSDCGSYCGDYTCDYGEYCPSDCSDEYYCSDAIDNDGDGCMDWTDVYCGGTESKCSDGQDNDCDGYYDSADSDCPSEPGGYCGNLYCDGNETVSNCPGDCCEWDCTSKQDNVCHYECNGYQGCQTASECDGVTSGVTICTSDSSYVSCCSDEAMYCGINQYCSGGSCVICSNMCDGTCYSYNCQSDPDCNMICGDNCCAQGENPATCPTDCREGETCPVCDDYNPCTLNVCNETTSFKCDYWDQIPCCGNGLCETGESSVTCPNDCAAEGELLLKIIYPRTNTSYFRGNMTQIRTQLNYGSERVYDGSVSCWDPTENPFSLEFDADLYYSGEYEIKISDPSGAWNLLCDANVRRENETISDSDFVRLQIKDRLIIDITQMDDMYVQGELARIVVNVSYDNGTIARGVNITAETPEGNINLDEVGDGMYELSYVMNTLGSFNISLSGVDMTGTTTFTGLSITSVKPFNPLDYAWLIPVALVVSVVAFFGRRRLTMIKVKKGFQERISSKEARMLEIKDEKKKIQNDFLQTRITETDFKDKMKALDTEYQKLDMEIKDLRNVEYNKKKE